MNREVIYETKGMRARDGAGVQLVRVFGNRTTDIYDPFLMFDAFDSKDKSEYEAGFPMHPHRGIETVSFLSKGEMTHRDHLGIEATIYDGEAQWLTAGSGAEHEEMPGGERISEKTAAKLGEGDRVLLETKESGAEILIYSSKRLDEPVAWYGPIVMNTHEEIRQAFEELNAGTFIKERADYGNQ